MIINNNLTIENLIELKESIISVTSIDKYQRSVLEESLKLLPEDLFGEVGVYFFYLHDYEKAFEYFQLTSNNYYLGRFYLHFQEYEKAMIELRKWAIEINSLNSLCNFNLRILFAKGEFYEFIILTEKFAKYSNLIMNNNLAKEIFNGNSIMGEMDSLNNFHIEYIINSMTNDDLNALVVSILNYHRCLTLEDFQNILEIEYPNIRNVIIQKSGVSKVFIKNFKNNYEEDIEKLRILLTSFKIKNLKGLLGRIDYLIDMVRYGGDLTLKEYENDPIMLQIKKKFIPYSEAKDAFVVYKNIVINEIDKSPNYKYDHKLYGLIDYYLMTNKFSIALDFLRVNKIQNFAEFTVLFNLLLLTDNDITAAEIVERQYVFFDKRLSKLVIDLKDDFIGYLEQRLCQIKTDYNKKFIHIIRDELSNIAEDAPLLTPICFEYKTIYKASPLYKKILKGEIALYTLNTERCGYFSNKYFNNIENDFRDSLGIRLKELGSDQEAVVYYLVKKLLPTSEIILQFSPNWLKPQRIDLFIRNFNLAIEYQGEQHFSPIEFFGGEEGLKKRKESDSMKYFLCKSNGVILEYINHYDNIEKKIKEILSKHSSIPVS